MSFMLLKFVEGQERLSKFSEVGRILSDSWMLLNVVGGLVKIWEWFDTCVANL